MLYSYKVWEDENDLPDYGSIEANSLEEVIEQLEKEYPSEKGYDIETISYTGVREVDIMITRF